MSIKQWFNTTMFSISDKPVTVIDITTICLLVLVSYIALKWFKYLLTKTSSRKTISVSAAYTISRIIQYCLIAAVGMTSLSILGLDMSKLAIVAGALSVGIGFGLQSIFNNFVSGLILLLERPLKVGDVVELDSGLKGRIKEINVRSTHLVTRDNVDVLVPNSEFISAKVINYTYLDPIRRLRIPFGVAYGSDKEKVKQAVLNVDKEINLSLNNELQKTDLWLVNFGESSLDFELVVWVDASKFGDFEGLRALYLWKIDTEFARVGIEIPFPQRDLHVKSINRSIDFTGTSGMEKA